jgi:D-alanyl-lipoteichoic acid acyltransferase DltB (MBOAT superfamily)
MITMLLGGLWHGAGWNFAIWGGLHGVYLCINHLWRRLVGDRPARTRVGALLAATITFAAVNVAWVFFRATSLEAGRAILLGMFGANGISVPEALVLRLPMLRDHFEAVGVGIFPGAGNSSS